MKELFSNFGKLFGANVLAQIILTVSLPVVGYFYKPELFGELGVVLAIASLLTIITTLKLDAYILTFHGSHEEIRANTSTVLKLSLLTAFPVVSICFLGLKLVNLDAKYQLDVFSFVFVFILVLVLSFNNILTSNLIRTENIKAVAYNAVIRAVLLVFFQVLFGFLGLLLGLIISELISRILSNIYLFKEFGCSNFHYKKSSLSVKKTIAKAKRYPFYVMPASLISNMNVQIPILLSASILDVKAAGLYFMANRIVSIPASMISVTLSKVFVPFIIKKEKKNIIKFITNFVLGLFLLLLIVSALGIVLLVLLEEYEPLEWAGVSEIIMLFLVLFPFMISVSSVSQVFNIYNQQSMLLKVDVMRFMFIILAVMYASTLPGVDLFGYTLYIVLASCLGYILQFIFILKAIVTECS